MLTQVAGRALEVLSGYSRSLAQNQPSFKSYFMFCSQPSQHNSPRTFWARPAKQCGFCAQEWSGCFQPGLCLSLTGLIFRSTARVEDSSSHNIPFWAFYITSTSMSKTAQHHQELKTNVGSPITRRVIGDAYLVSPASHLYSSPG